MDPTTFAFPPSAFVPLAVGFFGLGSGYFIWGGQTIFGFPRAGEGVEATRINQTMGVWGFLLPGFMQFITGVYILVGITWLQVFTINPNGSPASTSALLMAGLAFTAYGVHWFGFGIRRYINSNPSPDAWVAVVFFILSVLGVVVFIGASDIPVAIVFIGLSLIYLTEFPARFGWVPGLLRLVGVWQLLTGIWLMYLTWAVTLDMSLGAKWPI